MACSPGGNALKLVGKPNRAEVPVGSNGLPTYISGEFLSYCLLLGG